MGFGETQSIPTDLERSCAALAGMGEGGEKGVGEGNNSHQIAQDFGLLTVKTLIVDFDKPLHVTGTDDELLLLQTSADHPSQHRSHNGFDSQGR